MKLIILFFFKKKGKMVKASSVVSKIKWFLYHHMSNFNETSRKLELVDHAWPSHLLSFSLKPCNFCPGHERVLQ